MADRYAGWRKALALLDLTCSHGDNFGGQLSTGCRVCCVRHLIYLRHRSQVLAFADYLSHRHGAMFVDGVRSDYGLALSEMKRQAGQ